LLDLSFHRVLTLQISTGRQLWEAVQAAKRTGAVDCDGHCGGAKRFGESPRKPFLDPVHIEQAAGLR
jgi:hypothetical protein